MFLLQRTGTHLVHRINVKKGQERKIKKKCVDIKRKRNTRTWGERCGGPWKLMGLHSRMRGPLSHVCALHALLVLAVWAADQSDRRMNGGQ
jgi:hypothetical protein